MTPYRPIKTIHKLATNRRILLLQGPIGRFFVQLSDWLTQQGCAVYKINFNGGDEWFYPNARDNTFTYTQSLDDFGDYLIAFVAQHGIDAVACFGDTRAYHRIAKSICAKNNVSFWAFEEGYFRPDWIVLEEHGVNAYSQLPRVGAFFVSQVANLTLQDIAYQKIPHKFRHAASYVMQYYAAMKWRQKRYPHYQHHRATSLAYYTAAWLRSGWRKMWFAWREAKIAQQIQQSSLQPFFVFPLQVATDSQIKTHSQYTSVRDALLHVLASFAVNAPADCHLIVKHHPMDRGFIDYAKTIRQFIAQHPNVAGRIVYVHDIPLPIMLRKARGVVTINSTSGLSALIHGLPVKVLGRAAYDIPSITSHQPLSHFWCNPQLPDAVLFNAYRRYHLYCTHINGSYYTQTHFPS